jgi:hypothetical protein
MRNTNSPYARFDWSNCGWLGGFGRQVLGETWINHHGEHGKESTRGILNEAMTNNPILRGMEELWRPSDVYAAKHLSPDAQILVLSHVISETEPSDPPLHFGRRRNVLNARILDKQIDDFFAEDLMINIAQTPGLLQIFDQLLHGHFVLRRHFLQTQPHIDLFHPYAFLFRNALEHEAGLDSLLGGGVRRAVNLVLLRINGVLKNAALLLLIDD